jgi:hypothetical protein
MRDHGLAALTPHVGENHNRKEERDQDLAKARDQTLVALVECSALLRDIPNACWRLPQQEHKTKKGRKYIMRLALSLVENVALPTPISCVLLL